ncbi:MAG: DUF374 domain-containing protein [Gammaproteobacteria bacterium]|nr:DUF374 domain-containing protein [Gammaproteobacteria bacterium]MDH4313666.1 DUF374 domain-containing protein [Gammaproteobacteria bacterium]MDH5215411.1 DUF374 domain-containing protein [Gammaproteobacteria bacterium]
MTDENTPSNFSDIQARRSPSSSRQRSLWRRAYYAIGMPILQGVISLLFRSYRIEAVIGQDVVDRLINSGTTCAPCYWHQHLILGNLFLRKWITRGFRAGFLISASVDGDVPSRIARSWGAEVVRGSANNTGALVLRDMHGLFRRGISVVSIADGPTGPKAVFKTGVVLMARIANVPMVPIGCAAESAWYLNRWDDFMIPKPFSRIVLAVGEPVTIPPKTPVDAMENYRQQMEDAVKSLCERSKELISR